MKHDFDVFYIPGTPDTHPGMIDIVRRTEVTPYIPAQVRRLCLWAVPAYAFGRGFTA